VKRDCVTASGIPLEVTLRVRVAVILSTVTGSAPQVPSHRGNKEGPAGRLEVLIKLLTGKVKKKSAS